MYDIRQFKPALYLMVLTGLTAFSVASGRPGLWIVMIALVVVNAWLVYTGRLRPLPRAVSGAIVLALGVWVGVSIAQGELPIGPIATFLAATIGVKLFEQRVNRDYGQIIVLSLLLVVAGTMESQELRPSIIVMIYLVLAVYCSLLFHLKVETDAAREAMGLSDDSPIDEFKLRQDQRRLSSSMRRLTMVLGTAAVVSAAVVFLAFPRGPRERFLGSRQFTTAQAVTGFSGQVNFQDIARINQNEEVVGYVELLRNGVAARNGETIYLRGNTMDRYIADPDAADRWTWQRSDVLAPATPLIRAGRTYDMPAPRVSNGIVLEQRIELEPTGVDMLFGMAGTFTMRSDEELRVDFYPSDGTMVVVGRPVAERRSYTLWGDGVVPTPIRPVPDFSEERLRAMPTRELLPLIQLSELRDRVELQRLDTLGEIDLSAMSPDQRVATWKSRLGTPWGGIYPRNPLHADANRALNSLTEDFYQHPPQPVAEAIKAFALDPEVTGYDDEGEPLALKRIQRAGTTEYDERLARRIDQYLRREFRYTLDLTDVRPSDDLDPMGWFVGDTGQLGHCEYFAGSMALACQALGIPARVVVGFKVDEFNPRLGKFVVRQSHAHAWVEVLTERGWVRFDPTTSRLADSNFTRDTGLMATLWNWVEYVEYTWANRIVGYDQDRQSALGQELNQRVLAEGGSDIGLLERLRRSTWDRFVAWLDGQNLYVYSAYVMAWVIFIGVVIALAAISYFIYERWRLRNRLKRIGLTNLPASRARRLARQLAFYDDMVRLLERRGYRRRPSQTPREFAASLDTLPTRASELVAGLTDVFYRVRYGSGRLPGKRRRRLDRSLEELEVALG
ncbi:MAG: DUF3488 and transglutaminase-like domain-containing protein [Planctomycetota bacterium]